jgi:translation elongation factor EF-Ts
MLDCRQALEHSAGDMEQAVEHIRRQAAAEAAKRAARVTGEGRIDSYIHRERARSSVHAVSYVGCVTGDDTDYR